ncbi:MAG: hypothetical protein WCJ64_15255 [Rhodospirillaceae bacterium]
MRYDEAGQLLGDLVKLLGECGVGALIAHRAETAVGEHGADLDARGRAVRAGGARAILDLRGLIPPQLADLLAGELLRANDGEPPLLPDRRIPAGKKRGPTALDARARLVLRAHHEAGQTGVSWWKLCQRACTSGAHHYACDTIRAWGREVAEGDKARAKRLGKSARLRREPTPDDALWLAEVLRLDLTMAELARVAGEPV